MKENLRLTYYIVLAIVTATAGTYFLVFKSGFNKDQQELIVMVPLCVIIIWLIIAVYNYRVVIIEPEYEYGNVIEGEIVD